LLHAEAGLDVQPCMVQFKRFKFNGDGSALNNIMLKRSLENAWRPWQRSFSLNILRYTKGHRAIRSLKSNSLSTTEISSTSSTPVQNRQRWTVEGDKTWKPWEKNFEGIRADRRQSLLSLWVEYWQSIRWQRSHNWMHELRVTRKRWEHAGANPGLRWTLNDRESEKFDE
jgi:hypothetical protein